ncbi:MAG: sigma-E processing peptidase SpoIIGA [Lachnospiraceae bacterium]|nr:sigma-E processing peptidase SpoIIGA [Lachnospiraceae bacterium]
MYYRIYLDQLFLEELLILALVLRICGVLLGIRISWKRTWLVSSLGAVAECACLFFRIGGGKISRGIMAVILAAFCAALGFCGRKRTPAPHMDAAGRKRNFVKCVCRSTVYLLISAGLFGGLSQIIFSIWEPPALLAAALIYMIISILIRRQRERMVLEEYRTEITLEDLGDRLLLTGLIDTGNHLIEPMTGRPVSILDPQAAQKIKRFQNRNEEGNGGLYIPYHSIGKDRGWMWGMVIDAMYIKYKGEEIRIDKPVLAVSGERLGRTEQYQIIVNPLEVCVR